MLYEAPAALILYIQGPAGFSWDTVLVHEVLGWPTIQATSRAYGSATHGLIFICMVSQVCVCPHGPDLKQLKERWEYKQKYQMSSSLGPSNAISELKQHLAYFL